MTLLVTCPVILPPSLELVASWNHRPHLCVINGHGRAWSATCEEAGIWRAGLCDGRGVSANLGCPAAWNVAFSIARLVGVDYVAIVSHSTIIAGGTARLAELVERHADERGLTTSASFHAIVFSVALWERIGGFDEGFSPGYYEDMDFVRRLYLADEWTPAKPMPFVGAPQFRCTDARSVTVCAGVVPAKVHDEGLARFRAKWGGDPYHETYQRPFDPTSVGGSNVAADLEATA
jgi:hypothetical protein